MNELVIFKIASAAGYWLVSLGLYWIGRFGYWRSLLLGSLIGGAWDYGAHRLLNAAERWGSTKLDDERWGILVALWIVLALFLIVTSQFAASTRLKTLPRARQEPFKLSKKLGEKYKQAASELLFCNEMYEKAIAEKRAADVAAAAQYLNAANKRYNAIKREIWFATGARVGDFSLDARVAYFLAAFAFSICFSRAWLMEEFV